MKKTREIEIHLLACIAEECAEVQKECMKAIRFGLDDTHPKYGGTNLERIRNEFTDLVAVIELFEQMTYLDIAVFTNEDILKKKEKIKRYMATYDIIDT